MSDNTALSNNSGGDSIRTESLGGGTDQTSGAPLPTTFQGGTSPEVKVQLVKLLGGRSGTDGGVITRDNPAPVIDIKVMRVLDVIVDQVIEQTGYLKEIRDFLRKGH